MPILTTAGEQLPAPPASGKLSALADIAFVIAASSIAFVAEDFVAAREWITIGPEARGVSAVVIGACAAIAVVLFRGGTLADLGLKQPERWSRVPLQALVILIAFIAAQVLMPIVVSAFITVPEPDMSRYDSLAGDLRAAVALMLLLPIIAAIPEEIIYRGFLLGRFAQMFSGQHCATILAVCLQGLMFGAVHFQWGPGGMLVATMMGLIWGTAFVVCGRNLWVVILAHSAGHVLGVLQLYLGKSIII